MLTAVDLFAGAGGFSLGLRRAGFDVILANEFSTEPEWTYRANLLSGKIVYSRQVLVGLRRHLEALPRVLPLGCRQCCLSEGFTFKTSETLAETLRKKA